MARLIRLLPRPGISHFFKESGFSSGKWYVECTIWQFEQFLSKCFVFEKKNVEIRYKHCTVLIQGLNEKGQQECSQISLSNGTFFHDNLYLISNILATNCTRVWDVASATEELIFKFIFKLI